MLNKAEWQAIIWVRQSPAGVQIRRHLESKLAEAREVYETKQADEQQRLLVVAYKKALAVLSSIAMEDL